MQCSSNMFNTLCDCINLTALSTKTLFIAWRKRWKNYTQEPLFFEKRRSFYVRNARMPNFALPPFLHFPPFSFLPPPPPAPLKKEGKEQRLLSLCRGEACSLRCSQCCQVLSYFRVFLSSLTCKDACFFLFFRFILVLLDRSVASFEVDHLATLAVDPGGGGGEHRRRGMWGAPNRPSLAGGEAEKVGEEEAVLNRAPGRKGGAGEERREKISLGRCVVYM